VFVGLVGGLVAGVCAGALHHAGPSGRSQGLVEQAQWQGQGFATQQLVFAEIHPVQVHRAASGLACHRAAVVPRVMQAVFFTAQQGPAEAVRLPSSRSGSRCSRNATLGECTKASMTRHCDHATQAAQLARHSQSCHAQGNNLGKQGLWIGLGVGGLFRHDRRA